jgi:hypothetical protein
MIFWLFALSVACLEALLHRDSKKRPARKPRPDLAPPPPPSPVTNGLISLDQAIRKRDSQEIPAGTPASAAASEHNRYNRDGGGTE